ncbi:hypothetical protein ACSHWF_09220 [Aerococcus urinaeequi]|uniref:Uncharacterized protein n=3 Tax=Aerococcus TaxID=1375 RepID=A0A1W1ZKY2_9LACT|nr:MULTISPECIES: hypothetical protein [Aerococcus]QOQ78574.1 hypothetical protein IMX20_06100 [Aerococcus urinaeequi]SMC48711.1 hypothetical protein SAMN04487984_1361 [Aerococcus suis]
MYLTIFAIFLVVAGFVNGYIFLFKYPKEFQSTKIVHGFLTLFLLLIGLYLLLQLSN